MWLLVPQQHSESEKNKSFILIKFIDMKTRINSLIILLTLIITLVNAQDNSFDFQNKRWKDVATKMPLEWYGSDDAIAVAENVLLAQKTIGGWEKNKDYHKEFTAKDRAHYINDKSEIGATFDNNATIAELRFLAKMYSQVKDERYKQAFENGMAYIFISQYSNGGWPQFFPVRKGSVAYSGHITYNDNAMINTMNFLKDIYSDDKEYVSLQLNGATKIKAKQAFDKGIQCFLDTQIIYEGVPSVWCAQHNSVTLVPAKARSYELPSFSGSESVGIVAILMNIDKPSAAIIASVKGAVQWFENNKLEGIKLENIINNEGEKDRVVVQDKDASPLWARFYDLETCEPFFCSRDGIKRDYFAEISYNRRNGYSWYVSSPQKILKAYPEWLESVDSI